MKWLIAVNTTGIINHGYNHQPWTIQVTGVRNHVDSLMTLLGLINRLLPGRTVGMVDRRLKGLTVTDPLCWMSSLNLRRSTPLDVSTKLLDGSFSQVILYFQNYEHYEPVGHHLNQRTSGQTS